MAEKKPLVLKNGYTQELQEGDTLPTESMVGGTKAEGRVPVVQADGTVVWEELPGGIPDGGIEGQVLVKQADGTISWKTLESGVSLGLAIALS